MIEWVLNRFDFAHRFDASHSVFRIELRTLRARLPSQSLIPSPPWGMTWLFDIAKSHRNSSRQLFIKGSLPKMSNNEIPLDLFRSQMQDYAARFVAAMENIEYLPDVMVVDANIAIAVQKAITVLESFTKLTPVEHVERLAKACATDMAELTEHRTTISNAERNLARIFQPGEVEAKQRIEQQRDDAERRIPVLEERIRRMGEVLQVLNPIPEEFKS